MPNFMTSGELSDYNYWLDTLINEQKEKEEQDESQRID